MMGRSPIEAGADLDRAVAEAIGLRLGDTAPVGKIPSGEVPSYSTDLNAAFAAAEKVGLFDSHVLGHDPAGWNVWPVDYDRIEPTSFFEPTPALAICAAILELRESGDVPDQPARTS